jgi:hypothetical protein
MAESKPYALPGVDFETPPSALWTCALPLPPFLEAFVAFFGGICTQGSLALHAPRESGSAFGVGFPGTAYGARLRLDLVISDTGGQFGS